MVALFTYFYFDTELIIRIGIFEVCVIGIDVAGPACQDSL